MAAAGQPAQLIADYWLIRRTDLRLADLYRPHGGYWYAAGVNWRAVLSLAAGALLAVGGAWSAPGQGPFPVNGLIPALKPLYDYNWVVGFAVALMLYLGLNLGRRGSMLAGGTVTVPAGRSDADWRKP